MIAVWHFSCNIVDSLRQRTLNECDRARDEFVPERSTAASIRCTEAAMLGIGLRDRGSSERHPGAQRKLT
jgi:hypothetical protein